VGPEGRTVWPRGKEKKNDDLERGGDLSDRRGREAICTRKGKELRKQDASNAEKSETSGEKEGRKEGVVSKRLKKRGNAGTIGRGKEQMQSSRELEKKKESPFL